MAPSGWLMSKKIDYTLCIEPDDDELQKIEQALKQMVRGTDSVSQSVQPMLKYRPLFGATEIKKASGPDALPQLAVWSCAGLTKLSRLVQDSRNKLPLPSLPCWSVVGHQWQLYMAKRCSDTLVVSIPERNTSSCRLTAHAANSRTCRARLPDG
jgi:hypothetical protein